MSLVEVIYNDSDNPNTVTMYQDGTALDFDEVTRMVCVFVGTDIVADSSVDASLFDWSQGSGILQFNFNYLDIPPGIYYAKLRVFDPLHTNGQILAHPDGAVLQFKFAD